MSGGIMTKLFLLIFILLPLTANGQVTVVEVTTDTVAIFEQEEQTTKALKSAKLAMLASAAIPGIGQQYLGKRKSALAFFGMEVLSVFGAVFLEKYSRQLENDAHGYAALHAGVDVRGKDERFWTAVGRFSSMQEYHRNLSWDRQPENLYTSESMNWKWGYDELSDEQHREKFNGFRDASRKIHIAASACIGAMIINRIVSIVDIRASTKYKSQEGSVSFRIQPDFSSDFSSAGITISTGF